MIPAGWTEKKLGEICRIAIGKTPSRGDKVLWDPELQTDNTWLSIADLNSAKNKIVEKSTEHISDKALPLMTIVPKGTLLLSFKLTIGRLAFAGKDLYTNEAIAQLPIKEGAQIDKYYLYYYLSAFNYETLLKGDIKVKGKSLNKQKLDILPVYYPSLPEQQRIVKKLDKLFADIDAQKQIAQQNLQNAKDLFDATVDNFLTVIAVEKDAAKLKDVCVVERGSSPRPIKKFITDNDNGINWIRIGDCSGKYVTSTAQKITQEGAKKSRLVKHGDFIISNSMSYGKPYILKIDGCIHDGWFVLRLNEGLVNPEFLYYVLSSVYARKQYDKLAAGAIVLNISSDLIKKVSFPLPSMGEQKKIVQKFDVLQEQTQELEKIYTQQIADLDELKQAILKKAFNGEL